MYTIETAAAAVTGARHLRVARNGQDAAAVWMGQGCGAAIVCDGCSSGAYSEVGARLGAQLGIELIREALTESRVVSAETPTELGRPRIACAPPRDIWPAVRAQLAVELARIADGMSGTRERVVHDHFLFTIVAAAWRGDEVAVWALGDGGYALGDRVVELGPFSNNQPPYLGYDLLGNPQPAHLEVANASCGRVAVATDGVIEVGLGDIVRDRRLLAHPDALRRRLAVLAKGSERIDWDEQRVVRQAAQLQDDGAVAMLRWEMMS